MKTVSQTFRICGFLSFAVGVILASCSGLLSAEEPAGEIAGEVPPVEREFRAAWVATVANIDWPSRPGLSTEKQQAEMIAILDTAVRLKLNAIILQVRPSCDAMYASELEPWSEFLTGTMGKPPEPFYDPLEFAITEAHRRGIELHGWFNPYRARHSGSKSPVSKNHISQTRPELVKQYGGYNWLDPGEPAATDHTLAVIRDVVERYDIDGIHMDDYFYPYPVNGDDKKPVSFPDDPSWQKAVAAGTTLERDDWRRENVDQLVSQMYRDIKAVKPWVKFGISPFGIGRPEKPPQIKGFDQYESLYADAEKWFTEGWVDYFTPQLYWKIGPPEQSYSALLYWWNSQNKAKRHLWPGNYTSRVGGADGKSWPAKEIVAQIWVTRAQEGASGNVHFSMKALQRNAGGIADALRSNAYQQPALVPASPWLESTTNKEQAKPKFTVKKSSGEWVVSLETIDSELPWLWVIRSKHAGKWHVDIVPGGETTRQLYHGKQAKARQKPPSTVAVSTVNRIGEESPLSWYGTESPQSE
ncbi:glycoside hydrolase family 10 protein [Bythopirellula polymerisocia]|nr:family 10 glycosylhydrolase [Bythopirellula polymerisocia]